MNIAFLIYNRSDLTERVFREIARARPSRLLVVADGPRNAEDVEKCRAARAVVDAVDWPCGVLRNYSETNLGCKRRVSSGLDWVFSQVSEAVILEDDCLPSPDFFRFCGEMLERYRNDTRVGDICGGSYLRGKKRTCYSYFFSRHAKIWGWATWRRAWQQYDVDMKLWPELRAARRHFDLFPFREHAVFFEALWDEICAGKIDTWDVQWAFARMIHGTVTITPVRNLVSNIGFREDASRTRDASYPFAALPLEQMEFPLVHPPCQICDAKADADFVRVTFPITRRGSLKWILQRLQNKHFYGYWIRQLPLVGDLWARIRKVQ